MLSFFLEEQRAPIAMCGVALYIMVVLIARPYLRNLDDRFAMYLFVCSLVDWLVGMCACLPQSCLSHAVASTSHTLCVRFVCVECT
jgi:hypothetical protein